MRFCAPWACAPAALPGFASPKEAGRCIAAMKQSRQLPPPAEAALADGVAAEEATAALKALAEGGN